MHAKFLFYDSGIASQHLKMPQMFEINNRSRGKQTNSQNGTTTTIHQTQCFSFHFSNHRFVRIRNQMFHKTLWNIICTCDAVHWHPVEWAQSVKMIAFARRLLCFTLVESVEWKRGKASKRFVNAMRRTQAFQCQMIGRRYIRNGLCSRWQIARAHSHNSHRLNSICTGCVWRDLAIGKTTKITVIFYENIACALGTRALLDSLSNVARGIVTIIVGVLASSIGQTNEFSGDWRNSWRYEGDWTDYGSNNNNNENASRVRDEDAAMMQCMCRSQSIVSINHRFNHPNRAVYIWLPFCRHRKIHLTFKRCLNVLANIGIMTVRSLWLAIPVKRAMIAARWSWGGSVWMPMTNDEDLVSSRTQTPEVKNVDCTPRLQITNQIDVRCAELQNESLVEILLNGKSRRNESCILVGFHRTLQKLLSKC